MKPLSFSIRALVLAALAFSTALLPAQAGEEQDQLAILASPQSTPTQRDTACARLQRIGTPQCVPQVAQLLADEALSHSARLVLETLPGPEAGAALTDALAKTTGALKAGILYSLGIRGDSAAVPAMILALDDKDPQAADAAAQALGKIATEPAVKGLETAFQKFAKASPPDAICDALLDAAASRLSKADSKGASKLYEEVYRSGAKEHIRLGAYKGIILAAPGPGGVALAVKGITSSDNAAQGAALQLVRQLEAPGATKAFAAVAEKAQPAVQVAIIEGLRQRGDPAAAPTLSHLVKQSNQDVRAAALGALGSLGDASLAGVLVEAAASTNTVEQRQAREALLQISRGNMGEALLQQLAAKTGPAQLETVRALAARSEKSAVPGLVALAAKSSGATQAATCRALAQLAEGADVPMLVQLVVKAQDEAARGASAEMLGSVCQRLQAGKSGFDPAPLLTGIKSGSPEAREALLEVCGPLNHPHISQTLRAAVADSQPRIRAAGVRALCENHDPALLPDLLALATQASEMNFRVLAVRGYVRMVTEDEEGKYTPPERLAHLKRIADLARRPEEQRLVLAGVASVGHPDALGITLPLLGDDALGAEASLATTRIAAAIAGSQRDVAKDALTKVLATTHDPAAKKAAEALMQQIEGQSDFITDWQVAGPYRQNGKDYQALFDIVFQAETLDASGVNWRSLAPSTDPQRPWLMDLLKPMPGEQCVAYVRTRVISPAAQAAVLELGTDDGVKAWLNGTLVHANNTARPITPGSDKVPIKLQAGANSLVLKITQNNQGWEFSARITKPDGSRLLGVHSEPVKP